MCYGEPTSQLDTLVHRVVARPVSPAGHLGRRPCVSYRAPGWLVRHLARLSRVQVCEARSMCYGEHTSQLDTFELRVVMWPVSPAGHPGRRRRASYRASGRLVRHLTRLSRVQVREARSMCYGEHTSQLDTFVHPVVMWPVSPAGHPGRRSRASYRASG